MNDYQALVSILRDVWDTAQATSSDAQRQITISAKAYEIIELVEDHGLAMPEADSEPFARLAEAIGRAVETQTWLMERYRQYVPLDACLKLVRFTEE